MSSLEITRTLLGNSLPAEIIQHIFAFLPPSNAIKCKRVCRYFQTCLSTTQFAAANIDRATCVATKVVGASGDTVTIADHQWWIWPSEYQQVYALQHLQHNRNLHWTSQNQIGILPPSIGCLQNLESIILSNNRLHGGIPPELGLLENLAWLELSHNEFSMSIPQQLGQLTRLTVLNLSHNSLVGCIPESIGNLSQLNVLFLANNRLSGPLPSTLENLKALKVLAIGNNQFIGELPSGIGKLSSLQYCGLECNRLNGNIPWMEFVGMQFLAVLKLFGNAFDGIVPPDECAHVVKRLRQKVVMHLGDLQQTFSNDM